MKKDAVGPGKTRRTFYLPDDVDGWLEKQAEANGRSVSNYLVSLLKASMGSKPG